MEPAYSQPKYCSKYLQPLERTFTTEQGEKRRFDALQLDPLVAQDEQLSLKIRKVTQGSVTEAVAVSEEHVRRLLESSHHLRRTSLIECKSYLSVPEHFQALKIVLWKSPPSICHQMLLHLLQKNRQDNNWDFYHVVLQEVLQRPTLCEGYLDELLFCLNTPQLCDAELILECLGQDGESEIDKVSVRIPFPKVILCQFRYFADFFEPDKFQEGLNVKREIALSFPFTLDQPELEAAGEDFLNFAAAIIEAQKTKKRSLFDYPTNSFYTTALLLNQIGEIDAFRSLLTRWNHSITETITAENYKTVIQISDFLRNFPELLETIAFWMVGQSIKGQISFMELRDFFHAHFNRIISLRLNYSLSFEIIEFRLMKLLFGYFHAMSFSKCKIVFLENSSFGRSLSTLKVLTFDECTGITDEILSYLPPSLSDLSISCSPITIKGVKQLVSLPLKSFAYNFNDMNLLVGLEQQLDVEFLQAISSIATLKKIDLDGCHFPENLEWKNFPASVEYLDLSNTVGSLLIQENNLKCLIANNCCLQSLEWILAHNQGCLKIFESNEYEFFDPSLVNST